VLLLASVMAATWQMMTLPTKGAAEVQEVAPTKDPIEDATLDDVEFIDDDANEEPLLV
jgi:hypothetical protein